MSKYTDLSDDDLLDRYHKTGDNDWLGILLERYSLLLYGFCSRLLHDSTLARDAVQQVQLTVIQYLARNQVTNFPAWLFTIARHDCAMIMRKRREFYREIEDDDASETPSIAPSAFEEHQERFLEQALTTLTEAQLVCIRSFYLSGARKSYQDVARETGFTVSEVKTHIQNGKRSLRRTMDRLKNQYP